MRQGLHQLRVATEGKGLVELTREVADWVRAQRIETGLLTLFCRHTSAFSLFRRTPIAMSEPTSKRFLAGSRRKMAPATFMRPKGWTTCQPTSGRR